jgi:hypothetical protein
MYWTVPSSIQAVAESNTTVEDNVTDAVDLTPSSTDKESSKDVSSSLELDIVLHHRQTFMDMGRIIHVIITSHRRRSLL